MAVTETLGEGPEFAERVQEVERLVEKLEGSDWDFEEVPEVLARDSRADVVAKEIVHIHDGRRMVRIGQLVMGGVGEAFNLMGPIPASSKLRIGGTDALEAVNAQIPGHGLEDMDEYRELGEIQQVDFYNYGIFYQLRDLVFYLLLHDSGCFPSTLEYMVREFGEGKVVQNDMYAPRVPSFDPEDPVLMQGSCLQMEFPSPVVQWMDRPLYGGLAEETVHAETLLTLEPTQDSHPYLPLRAEGTVEYCGQRYHAKRFGGVSPKGAVRGPGVPEEGADIPRQEGKR